MTPLAQYIYNYFGREAIQALIENLQVSDCPGTVIGKFLDRAGFQPEYSPKTIQSRRLEVWFLDGKARLSYRESGDKEQDSTILFNPEDPARFLDALACVLRELGILEIDLMMTGAEAQDAQQLDADSVLGPTVGYNPIYEE